MKYSVRIKKKVARGLKKLPQNVQKLLFLLIEDLKSDGPIQKSWNNYYSDFHFIRSFFSRTIFFSNQIS